MGNPSIYSQYIPQGEAIGADDPTHYAKSLGMCVGDVGFFIGFDICSRISQEYPISPAILPKLCQEFALVGFAQMQDVHLAEGATTPDFDEIMEVYRLKTARYTFSLPLRLGGMLAGKDEKVLTQLDKLGEHIGIIFQIRDDAIGLFSTEEEIGKPIGSDLRENKKTLIRALLSTNLPAGKLKIVAQISQKEQINKKDLETIKEFMNEYGIQKQIDTMLEEHTTKSLNILRKLPISEEYKPVLQDLISFVATRTS
jgi:geranylgeranyl diphosphate synthase type I